MSEIKPCPFCGSPAELTNLDKPSYGCYNTTGCAFARAYFSPSFYTRDWNRRPREEALEEALRWRLVSEERPEILASRSVSADVLVAWANRGVLKAFMHDTCKWFSTGNGVEIKTPTWWLPIPPRPAPGGEKP